MSNITSSTVTWSMAVLLLSPRRACVCVYLCLCVCMCRGWVDEREWWVVMGRGNRWSPLMHTKHLHANQSLCAVFSGIPIVAVFCCPVTSAGTSRAGWLTGHVSLPAAARSRQLSGGRGWGLSSHSPPELSPTLPCLPVLPVGFFFYFTWLT